MHYRAVVALLAATLSGCHHGSAEPFVTASSPVPHSVCYALELGTWTRDSYGHPPTMIALDDGELTGGVWHPTAGKGRVRPDIPQTRDHHPAPSWATDSLGVIHVLWSNTYSGYRLTLGRKDAETFRGRIVAFSDYVSTPRQADPEASVIARRRECATLGL